MFLQTDPGRGARVTPGAIFRYLIDRHHFWSFYSSQASVSQQQRKKSSSKMEEVKAAWRNGLVTGSYFSNISVRHSAVEHRRVFAAHTSPAAAALAPGEMLKGGICGWRRSVPQVETLAVVAGSSVEPELQPSCLDSREARGDASETHI